MQKTKAFTLAEVLITLTVIGIIAALTVPTLMVKYQKKTTETQFKQVYSMLTSALTQAITENDTPDTWSGVNQNALINGETDVSRAFAKHFLPYLKIKKTCERSHKNCWASTLYSKDKKTSHLINSSSNYIGANYILENGMIIRFCSDGPHYNHPFIAVDLN